MKKIILLFGLSAVLFTACSEDASTPMENENPPVSDNKVLMLKVDFQSYAFEGGKELTFPEADTFTITSDYVAPGDFGSIKLNYEEVNQPLFDGTIHWMGLGERSYPETLAAPQTFNETDEAAEMPALEDFEIVSYGDEGYFEFYIDHQSLWASFDQLELVKEYRENNPNAKVQVFLYTPSVGVGDPADWDWYVMLKN